MKALYSFVQQSTSFCNYIAGKNYGLEKSFLPVYLNILDRKAQINENFFTTRKYAKTLE